MRVLHDESLRLKSDHTFSQSKCKRKDILTQFPPLRPESKPVVTCQNPVTLGGDVHVGPTYHAVHVRRGDFQYKHTRLPAEQVNI